MRTLHLKGSVLYKKFKTPILYFAVAILSVLAFYEINNVREMSAELKESSCEQSRKQNSKLDYELNNSLNRAIVYFSFNLILFVQIGRLSNQKRNK